MRHIDALCREDRGLAAKRERIERVKGAGPVLSATLLAELPELGRLTDNQAAALAGVAPYNDDSGRRQGVRRIRGGRAALRRALYMPALCCTRHNPVLREFYTRLVARGKPHHVAVTAVMRKMVCLFNRMLADPGFEPS